MTVILVLVGIVIVVLAAVVLVAAPVRHAEAVLRGFSWHRTVQIGTRVCQTEIKAEAIGRGPERGGAERRRCRPPPLYL